MSVRDWNKLPPKIIPVQDPEVFRAYLLVGGNNINCLAHRTYSMFAALVLKNKIWPDDKAKKKIMFSYGGPIIESTLVQLHSPTLIFFSTLKRKERKRE